MSLHNDVQQAGGGSDFSSSAHRARKKPGAPYISKATMTTTTTTTVGRTGSTGRDRVGRAAGRGRRGRLGGLETAGMRGRCGCANARHHYQRHHHQQPQQQQQQRPNWTQLESILKTPHLRRQTRHAMTTPSNWLLNNLSRRINKYS